MKILFIAHDSMKGGSGRCLYELLLQIKPEDDIEPIVLVHNKNSLYEVLKKSGIETYYCRFGYTSSTSKSKWRFLFWKYIYRNVANIWAYLFLKFKINLKEIDVIQSNSSIIDFGAFLHRRTGIPLIWHLREFGKKDFGFQSFYPSLPQYMCANAKKIIAVSKILVTEFVKNGGDSNKIECVYDGVVGSAYTKEEKYENDNLLKIVMTGRMNKEKGHIYAIEAIRSLPQEFQNKVLLDFYGTGKFENSLRQKVCCYNLEKIIRFRGFTNNINKTLEEYDVGLTLSASEGFGRTTVEYMLSGLYVIGSNSGATPEILDYGKYGSLIPCGDSIAVAKEIEKIITKKTNYMELAQKGKAFAKENFCIETNYHKIIDVLRM